MEDEGEAGHHPPLEPGEEEGRLGVVVSTEDEVGGPDYWPEDKQHQAGGGEHWHPHLEIEETWLDQSHHKY